MEKKKSKKQPMPKKGYTFTGWAIFNWGMSRDEVYRTRKEAMKVCYEGNITFKSGKREEAKCWNDVKDHMAVVKVKCIVI